MRKVFTQKEIVDYLKANPLSFEVKTGNLDNLNNKDYIFFDYLYDNIIGADNKAMYSSTVQFSVLTKDFEKRKAICKYIQKWFAVRFEYEKSDESEYYQATGTTEVFVSG